MTIFQCHFFIGSIILGFFAIILGIFGETLTVFWKSVTIAGKSYVNLRASSIRMIEKKANLDSINIAGIEHDWRNFSKKHCSDKYYTITDFDGEKYSIPVLVKISGWASILRVITVIRILWLVLIFFGILLQ